MKKKLIAGALVASMLLGMTACGSGSGSWSGSDSGSGSSADSSAAAAAGLTTDNITLSYWHYEDDTLVNYLAEAFMEKYPNITVETRHISDMSTDLSAAAAAKDFPDVFSGTDSDTALANQYWMDISEYFDNDPEAQQMLPSILEYGVGCFDTTARYAIPTWIRPMMFFVDRNVINKLNLEMPSTDWTWEEMIQLVKDATRDVRGEMKYYGLGYYTRLDSIYGISATDPAVRKIKGEFGFDGESFDLSYWAIEEQEFADLKLGGYVSPQQGTSEMESWSGDFNTWFGATGHVAVFAEGYWSFMNYWAQDGYQEQYGLDIVPYPLPSISGGKNSNIISECYMGGVSSSCKYPKEAYELLKFMTFGKEGWQVRLNLYKDTSIVNESGLPLKNAQMPIPMITDEEIWNGFKDLYYQYYVDAGVTGEALEEYKAYWDAALDACKYPIPYGWYNIAGYWNFCDQYFNSIGIHDLVDAGTAKAADYAQPATEQANYYHAEAMLSYFGPNGYDVLSDDEVAWYEAVSAAAGNLSAVSLTYPNK